MAACSFCRYYRQATEQLSIGHTINPRICEHPQAGKIMADDDTVIVSCVSMRSSTDPRSCGAEGRLFEPKEQPKNALGGAPITKHKYTIRLGARRFGKTWILERLGKTGIR